MIQVGIALYLNGDCPQSLPDGFRVHKSAKFAATEVTRILDGKRFIIRKNPDALVPSSKEFQDGTTWWDFSNPILI
jgi:hypothetical protein